MTIDTFDSSMPSTPDTQMLTTEAPAIRRRGPTTKPNSGDHRKSANYLGFTTHPTCLLTQALYSVAGYVRARPPLVQG